MTFQKIKKKLNKEKIIGTFVAIGLLAGAGTLVMPSIMDGFVYANSLQEELKEIENEIESGREKVDNLHGRADTLEGEVSRFNAEISELENSIEKSKLEKQQLEKKIKETKEKIAENQSVLGSTIGDMYMETGTSLVEVLASSGTIGDFFDRQENRTSVRDQVESSIQAIKKLRADLEEQRKEVEEVLAKQESQERQLQNKRADKKELLKETRGEEEKYKKKVEKLKEEREETQRKIEEMMRQRNSGGGGNYSLVSVGSVSAGDIVGRIGSTGFSTGPHLHFEVWEGGNDQDPNGYLSQSGWMTPTDAPVTQPYGNPSSWYSSGYHTGIDYGDSFGAPIRAASGGTLERGWLDGYGCTAIISHGGGVESLYAHMEAGSC